MNYRELRVAPLADLASMAPGYHHTAICSPGAMGSRPSPHWRDGYRAWAGFDHGERATIRRAMALDLSAHGFTA